VEAGSTNDQLICLTDFFATTAEIVSETVPVKTCEDSVSFLPALSGDEIESTRNGVIHHSFTGHFAYRQGPWKLLLARGSGGWSSPKENEASPDAPKAQLYNMQDDIGETTNLYTEKPEVVSELLALLEADVARGRSTEGAESENDIEGIVLWKSETGVSKKERKKKKGK